MESSTFANFYFIKFRELLNVQLYISNRFSVQQLCCGVPEVKRAQMIPQICVCQEGRLGLFSSFIHSLHFVSQSEISITCLPV